MKKKIKRRSDCPISFALENFGDKWSLLIIRDLMFKNKRTYGEFLNSEEKIATNILADRLSMLECAGLIKSKIDKEKKSKYNYELTNKGIDLVPVLLEIVLWSATHDKQTAAPKEFVNRVRNDKESFIKEIVQHLKGK
ncbi:MAG TPA: helix-turn-helix domain-containing protein [Chitinophagaceae bacterium]|nr:helix-turn-helix domain-containing protein [Chitinophagaceae bacterium]